MREISSSDDQYIEGFKDALESAPITCARCASLEAKLKRCRDVMECNDPDNARLIFGEPKP